MAASFKRNKAKIEAFLENNLTTILPHLYSEGLISPIEEEEIEHAASTKKAHTLTKILESRITNSPEIYVTVKQVLSTFDFREEESEENKDESPQTVTLTDGHSLPGTTERQPLYDYPSFHHVHTALSSHRERHKKPNRKELCLVAPRLRSEYRDIEFSNYYSNRMVGQNGATIIGEGIQLRIPPRIIKKGDPRTIRVQGCIDGPFELPEDVQLATPVFLVECTPHSNFHQEVTLRMQHFVHLKSQQDCAAMVFLTSKQIPIKDEHGHHWKFEISDQQPECYPNFIHGEVQLTHFSFLCFGIRRSRRVHPASPLPEYHYRVCLYLPKYFRPPNCHIIFSICLLHDIYVEKLQKYVDKNFLEYDLCKMNDVSCSIENEVRLVLPSTTPGYTITSAQSPEIIHKERVDKTRLRWWERQSIRRDRAGSGYPPLIVLTVTQTDPREAVTVTQLQFGVVGIRNEYFDGFSLATPTATPPRLSPRGSVPTLPRLLNFVPAGGQQINIPREVGADYFDFGTHLLQEVSGAHIRDLEQKLSRNGEVINKRILQEWLEGRGRPVTWATLVEVLNIIGKGELAEKIKEKYITAH